MPAVTDHRKIISDIRAGKLHPVYLLIGTETYFIDVILAELEKYAVAPEDRDFNYNLYYGNDTNAETVINCAQQFPVFADRKLVILKEAQGQVPRRILINSCRMSLTPITTLHSSSLIPLKRHRQYLSCKRLQIRPTHWFSNQNLPGTIS